MTLAPGTTSVSLDVQVVDDSGLPVTGLTAATFPVVYYGREREAAVSISLSDLAAITTSYTSGGLKERAGSTGYYRLDAPNAAFASASKVTIYGEGSGKHVLPVRVLVGYDPADTLRVGGTAQTARDLGASVLLSVGTGTGQVSVSGGKVPATLGPADVSGNLPSDVQAVVGATSVAVDLSNLASDYAGGLLDADLSGRLLGAAPSGDGFHGVGVWAYRDDGTSIPTAAAVATASAAAVLSADWSGVTLGTVTTVTTTTNLTNLPAAPTNWLTAVAVQAAAVTKIQSGLSTYSGGDTSGTTTLLGRLTSTRAVNLDFLDASVAGVPAGVWATGTRSLTDKAGFGLADNAITSAKFAAGSITAAAVAAGALDSKGNWLTAGAYSAPPSTSAIAAAVDATLSGSHGSGAWGSTTTGSGAYTVALTVTNGTNPVPSAAVALTSGAVRYVAAADSLGRAAFAVDAGNYAVAVTRTGYTFTPTSINVTGDTTHTYTLTPAAAPDPGEPADRYGNTQADLFRKYSRYNIETWATKDGAGTPDTAAVQQAFDDAAADIDGEAASRFYTLPLTLPGGSPYLPLFANASLALAAMHLYTQRGMGEQPQANVLNSLDKEAKRALASLVSVMQAGMGGVARSQYSTGPGAVPARFGPGALGNCRQW